MTWDAFTKAIPQHGPQRRAATPYPPLARTAYTLLFVLLVAAGAWTGCHLSADTYNTTSELSNAFAGTIGAGAGITAAINVRHIAASRRLLRQRARNT